MSTRYTRADRARHDWLELHAHALTVECPYCERPVEQPCTNPLTGEQIAAPAHHQRITRADYATQAAQAADTQAWAERSTSCDTTPR